MPYNHIDHPDEIIHWFKSCLDERDRQVLGLCPHRDCPHNETSVVAYGPSFEYYELIICDCDPGCRGNCRGWLSVRDELCHGLFDQVQWKYLGQKCTSAGRS